MPSISSWLSDVSRRKLRLAASGRDGLRDSINLHRFVLLKNSITQAESAASPPRPSSLVTDSDPRNSFVFPDATNPAPDSEAKWFESVLETLDDGFDAEVEVDVHPVDEDDDDDDLDFLDSSSNDRYEPWSHHNRLALDSPHAISLDFLSSTPSAVPPPFPQQSPLPFSFDDLDSPFSLPFVEPRYPEADLDLPMSESSDSSDDDEGPMTPYSGSQPSLNERGAPELEVYVEQDSYFLYPSELDPISPQPLYYQQC